MESVKFEKNKVNIDDGKVVITKVGHDNYYIKANGFSTMETSSKPLEPELMQDPHQYITGNNGWTVDASVNRCIRHIENELRYNNDVAVPLTKEGKSRLYEDIRTMIVNNEGRDSIYKLTGTILKGYREGFYRGVPFDVIFRAFRLGYI